MPLRMWGHLMLSKGSGLSACGLLTQSTLDLGLHLVTFFTTASIEIKTVADYDGDDGGNECDGLPFKSSRYRGLSVTKRALSRQRRIEAEAQATRLEESP
ncbi:hypothetical protein F4780DRAFT_783027 [Xylariomycetidae sp. FL0641]|nr:hypothetical protein F4780DRAFT_783027 [Xylariomycetidae sp. FL0641]